MSCERVSRLTVYFKRFQKFKFLTNDLGLLYQNRLLIMNDSCNFILSLVLRSPLKNRYILNKASLKPMLYC